jgi:hypothetical protein
VTRGGRGGRAQAAARSQLAAHVLRFGRLLRDAGLPIGTDRILDAVRTAAAVGIERREDFYWALHAALVSRRDQRELFDAAFRLFWREPGDPGEALPAPPRRPRPGAEPEPAAAALRAAEAWRASRARHLPEPLPDAEEAAHEGGLAASELERLSRRDFARMSAQELRRARERIARLRLAAATLPTRRLRPEPRGHRVDVRAALRASLRSGGRDLPLRWRAPRRRPPPLVVLCDISGSMERYSRVLLHFFHALVGARPRVEVFLFGTRLSHVTRALHQRDPDLALARLGAEVVDWSGGTRIARSLREFNLRWSRRVLAQGALVLLVTDGLEREVGPELAREAARLRRSCRRLVWLNPLVGYPGFEPRARGIQALLPEVDEVRPVHDLESLEQLARALGGLEPRGARGSPRRTPAPRFARGW